VDEVFGFCRACGRLILSGQPREHIGQWVYCLPFDSACVLLGRKSAGWSLTPSEAAALLAADALAAQ
jgi:hypothetical protein